MLLLLLLLLTWASYTKHKRFGERIEGGLRQGWN